jgi:hypothetical protein
MRLHPPVEHHFGTGEKENGISCVDSVYIQKLLIGSNYVYCLKKFALTLSIYFMYVKVFRFFFRWFIRSGADWVFDTSIL